MFGEIEQALKIFDIERAKTLLDEAAPLLLPTPVAADYTTLKGDVARMEDREPVIGMSPGDRTRSPKACVATGRAGVAGAMNAQTRQGGGEGGRSGSGSADSADPK